MLEQPVDAEHLFPKDAPHVRLPFSRIIARVMGRIMRVAENALHGREKPTSQRGIVQEYSSCLQNQTTIHGGLFIGTRPSAYARSMLRRPTRTAAR